MRRVGAALALLVACAHAPGASSPEGAARPGGGTTVASPVRIDFPTYSGCHLGCARPTPPRPPRPVDTDVDPFAAPADEIELDTD